MSDPVEVMTADECWEVLGDARMGRLAVSVDDAPDIFPINFALDLGEIIFATAPGNKLIQILINANVAFEVDGWNEDEAWSVVVKGVARELEREVDLSRVEASGLWTWVGTEKSNYVALEPASVTGRRFRRRPLGDEGV